MHVAYDWENLQSSFAAAAPSIDYKVIMPNDSTQEVSDMADLDTDTLCGCGCLPDCEECLTLVIKAGQPAVYLCECEGLDTCYM